MKDCREAIVAWQVWGVIHDARFTYSMGAERMSAVGHRGTVPVVADCSAWFRDCYNFAGAPDPMGLGYADPEGYTGTMLDHGRRLNPSEVVPGDAVVYGPGTGEHTATVVYVEDGNFLTVSMGEQGDPSFVWVNSPRCATRGFVTDGRQPQTFLRFATGGKKVFWPHGLTSGPSWFQRRATGLVPIDQDHGAIARGNGWVVYAWDGTWFRPASLCVPLSETRWANANYRTPRK